MAGTLAHLILVPMVYLSVGVCIVGCGVRLAALARAPRAPQSLKVYPLPRHPGRHALGEALFFPMVLRRRPLLWILLMTFHLALLLLVVAHLDLLPAVRIISPDSPHMLGSGAIGVVMMLCLTGLLLRRFGSPVRELSAPADYLLLLLLLLTVLSGGMMSWSNSWNPAGFVITKQDFGLYVDHLIRLRLDDPRTYLFGSHYIVLVVHVLFSNLLLLVLPFSRIVHALFTIPLHLLRRP